VKVACAFNSDSVWLCTTVLFGFRDNEDHVGGTRMTGMKRRKRTHTQMLNSLSGLSG